MLPGVPAPVVAEAAQVGTVAFPAGPGADSCSGNRSEGCSGDCSEPALRPLQQKVHTHTSGKSTQWWAF